MATIKNFTSLDQSKKLAEILPIESADMNYWCGTQIRIGGHRTMDKDLDVPCWSLAALLGVIRETTGYTLLGVNNFGVNNVYMSCILGDKPWKLETEVYDNEVDACVAMIIKLSELKML